MKTKILADFQICISVHLKLWNDFMNGNMIPEKWKENFECSYEHTVSAKLMVNSQSSPL